MRNEQFLNNYKEAEKTYKKTMDNSLKKYRATLRKKIDNLRSNNPKDYWKLLNSCKKKTKTSISLETLHDFFKDLNKGDENVENEIDLNLNAETNELINSRIERDEIEKAIKKLKNNKAGGEDAVMNEYIKHSSNKMIELYIQLFNIIFDSGKIPDIWLTGNIIPIYKNKGSQTDPKNYRPITIVSCFGKLFTAILNDRLQKFSEEVNLIKENQGGFRKNYSTIDNIFVLNTILSLMKAKKKKLYCIFIDFEKAFDKVWRLGLWNKMLFNDINGKMFNIIYNMYQCIKSRIVFNGEISDYFNCNNGLRQGENLSPFLFSLYLNDLEQFLNSNGVKGISCISDDLENDFNVYIKLFILLYADDTILFSENKEDLQLQLDTFYDYCNAWKLKVNIQKTKAMTFSTGRTNENVHFTFNGEVIENVKTFNYLGIIFSKGGSFVHTMKNNVNKAMIAMYDILKKGRLFNLSVKCQYDLFEKIVKPILLYGCEIWGFSKLDIIERVHLKFCKLLLNLKKSTPSYMIYGELGILPMSLFVKCRMVNFWIRTLEAKENKLSSILYKSLYERYETNMVKSSWIRFVKDILNECGLSYVWQFQHFVKFDENWLNATVKSTLVDQFKQSWHSDIETSSKGFCYRIFKTDFGFEKYIELLNDRDRNTLCRFRTTNHRFPIETGRWLNIERNERNCTLCNLNKLGDEYHYLLECPFFSNDRRINLGNYFTTRCNILKFKTLLQYINVQKLRKLCNFIRIINSKVCSP